MVGILNLDKPGGLTSAQAVGRLRRATGERRVGHGGTLDPLATGVLPIFFGRATLVAGAMTDHRKAYLAAIRFGAVSSTDDAEGELTPVPLGGDLDAAAMTEALAAFVGEIRQRPPAFSAISVGGERSYRAARRQVAAGAAVLEPLAERAVTVVALRLVSLVATEDGKTAGPLATVEVECGPGFYVRALARDLGAVLGTAAHLESLRRTRVGPFAVAAAVTLEDAVEAGEALEQRLQPASTVLDGSPMVVVDDASLLALARGGAVPAIGVPDGAAWAADAGGRVLALGRVESGRFHPRRLVDLG